MQPQILIKNLLLIGLLSGQLMYAQSNKWAHQFTGGTSEGYSIALDKIGNVYTAGTFAWTVDFDPSNNIFPLSSTGTSDVFICKFDSSGNFIWCKQFSGAEAYIHALALDTLANVYCTGSFKGNVDFDPGTNNFFLNASAGNSFISKLDSNGNFVWVKQIQALGNNSGASIAVDHNENVISCGMFNLKTDFDPGVDTFYLDISHSAYFLKLNSNGDFIWAKPLVASNSISPKQLKIDFAGNIVSTGFFNDSVDFDSSNNNYYQYVLGYTTYIHKMDSSGNLIWVKIFSGNPYGVSNGISLDLEKSGNIYTTGNFNGAVDFDPSPSILSFTSQGNYEDVYICKLDSQGKLLWAKDIAGPKWNRSNSISSDSNGDVFVAGRFIGPVDFDPGIGTYTLTSVSYPGNNYDNTFYLKLDSSGNFLWVGMVNGYYINYPNSTTINKSGDLFSTGRFMEKTDFDFGADTCFLFCTYGSYNAFVNKLGVCKAPIQNVMQSGDTLTASAINVTYQWLDCDSNYAIIPGETNQSFYSNTGGHFSVVISEYECKDTSACYYINGIEESSLNKIFIIYPNPSTTILHVKIFDGLNAKKSIILYDNTGKKILEKLNCSEEETIITDNINSGIYLIEMFDGENHFYRKLAVNNK